MHRALFVLAAVGGLLALLGVAGPSEAASASRTIALSGTFADPGFAQNGMDGFRCLLRPAVVCEGRVHSRTRFVSGNMRGHTDYEAWTGPNADPERPLEFSSYELYTGSVAGCGSPEHGPAVPGTFAFTVRGYVGFDGRTTGDWRFVPGSGTGGLAGIISASGREDGKAAHVEGSMDPTASVVSLTGTMTCSSPAAPTRNASKCRRARRPRGHRPRRRSCRHGRAVARHPH